MVSLLHCPVCCSQSLLRVVLSWLFVIVRYCCVLVVVFCYWCICVISVVVSIVVVVESDVVFVVVCYCRDGGFGGDKGDGGVEFLMMYLPAKTFLFHVHQSGRTRAL